MQRLLLALVPCLIIVATGAAAQSVTTCSRFGWSAEGSGVEVLRAEDGAIKRIGIIHYGETGRAISDAVFLDAGTAIISHLELEYLAHIMRGGGQDVQVGDSGWALVIGGEICPSAACLSGDIPRERFAAITEIYFENGLAHDPCDEGEDVNVRR